MKSLATGTIFAAAAVAHATAAWSPVKSPSFEAGSYAVTVSFDKAGDVGYSGGGGPGCPAFIRKTTDGGVTWDRVWPQGNCTASDFSIFLTAATRSVNESIIGGTSFQSYTMDGKTFNWAIDDFHSPPQDSAVLKDQTYASVEGLLHGSYGNYVLGSGNGQRYVPVRCPDCGLVPDQVIDSTSFPVRYGAFPTTNTWYVTAGRFDSLSYATRTGVTTFNLTEFLQISSQNGAAPRVSIRGNYKGKQRSAAILKTTDYGGTWHVVYKNQNQGVYPNGIHCANKQHCVAVLEGDGVRIIVTRDGGQTWKETMKDTDPHSSLLAVRMVSDTEVWVAGGQVSGKQEGRFYHSVDGGGTWKLTSVPNTYIMSLDMMSPHLGYAVALTTSNPAGVKLFKYSA